MIRVAIDCPCQAARPCRVGFSPYRVGETPAPYKCSIGTLSIQVILFGDIWLRSLHDEYIVIA